MENETSLNFQFPPGFRFHPSDEELIIHYLRNKVDSRPFPASIIAEVDLYKHNPWELPKKALFGEDEWYFFSPRKRKYPNGARPNRAAGSGYWKATGTDRPIRTCSESKIIGVKKVLVFYKGRPLKGIKTDWMMDEYRLLDMMTKPSRTKGSMRLDDWVLCRVRQRGSTAKNTTEVQDSQNRDSAWFIPDMEETCRTYISYSTDMITNCLSQDCQLLASILAGQALPTIETRSGVSNQGSNKDNSFTHLEEGSDKLNSSITIFSSDSSSTLKRKPNEDAGFNNLLLSDKKFSSINRYAHLLPRDAILRCDENYYGQNQSHDSFYNPNTFDHVTGLLDLNELSFSSKYLP